MIADEPAGTERGPFSAVSFVDAGEADAGRRLDNVLMMLLKNVPKSRVYRLLRKGEVRINGKRSKPEYRLQIGDRIRIPPVKLDVPEAQPAPSRSLQALLTQRVLHEDRDLLIINKPSGVAVHGGSGVSFGVIEALRAARPELTELELVHRLDRDTSGCLVLAKRRAALRELHAALREREMDKHYLALVVGKWSLGKKTVDLPLQTENRRGGERHVRVHPTGQQALSIFKPEQFFAKHATLMDVEIGTGRTHQIRVHAAHCGFPIAGDERYGSIEGNEALKKFGLGRMFLHAHSLQFIRPGTDETLSISAPLDDELRTVLDKLEAASEKKSPRPTRPLI